MLPAVRVAPDTALDAALGKLVSAVTVVPGELPERPDTPDLHITAFRRLPAIQAEFAPFPEGIDPRLIQVLRSRGIEQLYKHQADAIGHVLHGRNVVII